MPRFIQLTLVLSVIILLGAGCSTTEPEANSSDPAPITVGAPDKGTPIPEALVEYTGTEFNPEILRVVTGTKVNFVNKGETAIWPVSDSENCPEFDALSNLEPGETYSYTFAQAGECAFNNKLMSEETGLIDVRSAE